MKTKTITVCDAVCIDVSYEENDPVDIRCGGPAVLGYDFYVSPDENIKEIVNKVTSLIEKYHRPLMGISTHNVKNFNVENLWTIEKIEERIKKYDI